MSIAEDEFTGIAYVAFHDVLPVVGFVGGEFLVAYRDLFYPFDVFADDVLFFYPGLFQFGYFLLQLLVEGFVLRKFQQDFLCFGFGFRGVRLFFYLSATRA